MSFDTPTPGVTELLQQPKQDGWRLDLVTSDYTPMMRYIIERAGLAQFFDTTPSMVVEDSENGLQAAVGTACQCWFCATSLTPAIILA